MPHATVVKDGHEISYKKPVPDDVVVISDSQMSNIDSLKRAWISDGVMINMSRANKPTNKRDSLKRTWISDGLVILPGRKKLNLNTPVRQPPRKKAWISDGIRIDTPKRKGEYCGTAIFSLIPYCAY